MTCTTPPTLSRVITVHMVVLGSVRGIRPSPAACRPPSASRARPRLSMSGQDEDEKVLEWLLEATIILRRMTVGWRNASTRVKVSPQDIIIIIIIIIINFIENKRPRWPICLCIKHPL